MYHWGDKAKYVPEEPGVYAFYGRDQALIYVGESNNLREDFTHYLREDFSNDSCKRETKYYKRELTSRPEDRAKELLDEYKQNHGELPKCNRPAKPAEKEVASEQGFRFYEDLGKPLSETAFNLQDFRNKLSKVPAASLEFHQKRGDFAKWISAALKRTELAELVQKIDKKGEDLRRELLNSLNSPHRAACPKCATETVPAKTWKMAGRPSKTGERLQLTIGHYKCPKCSKTFRRVLAKEKIKAS